MKVVVCENCGAKYQLDDGDDINAFECSSCTGSLKELENFPNEGSASNQNFEEVSNSVLVYCKNCGMKYQIESDDDINDFECTSCEGPLDYVSNLNEQETTAYADSTDSSSDDLLYASYDSQDPTYSDDDEIIPIHADPDYNEEEYEIIPIHAEKTLEERANQEEFVPINEETLSYGTDESELDEIIPIHADSSVDEIIPIHADSSVDEIVPIHAESGVDEIVPIHAESGVDEIVPIHAEEDYGIVPIHEGSNDEYDEDYMSETQIPDIDSLESSPIYYEEDHYFAADYDDSDEEYEIIPIHAEKRYRETSRDISSGFAFKPVTNYSSQYDESYGIVPENDDENEEIYDAFENGPLETHAQVYDAFENEPLETHAKAGHLDNEGRLIVSEVEYPEEELEIDVIETESPKRAKAGRLDSEGRLIVEQTDDEEEIEDDQTTLTNLVEVVDIPDDEKPKSPISLARQALSEEDERLFSRAQNEMVFDSKEEYEAYKIARLKYYNALLNILKEEYMQSIDKELAGKSSIKGLFKREDKKESKKDSDDSSALVSKETVEMMKSQTPKYEPKKTFADIYILAGLFILVVSALYYYFVNRWIYILIAVAIGVIILVYGMVKKYMFNSYLARGRIIRERLLALPNDFYVFYAVQPPQSKDIINHVVVGPTGVFTILSKRFDSKEFKNKTKSDNETGKMVNDSASIQNYMDKKNTLELQTDYDDNQSRFQFGNEEIHFVDNSQIKRKALELNEDLAIFLDKKGFSGIYIEPLIGFVNDDLAILNVILTNEDLFIDELFNKMIRGQRRLDEITIARIAKLLSYYSADCSVY